jgi:AAA+ ATPase superfamily predicted ATPase
MVRGFKEEGVEVDERLVEEAVRELDGVVGWLAYFGYKHSREKLGLDKVLETASRLVASEVKRALEVYGPARLRYLEALRVMAVLGEARWSDVSGG